jgi:hypothetical protein
LRVTNTKKIRHEGQEEKKTVQITNGKRWFKMEVRLIGKNLWDEEKAHEQKLGLDIEKINKNCYSKKIRKKIYIYQNG